MTIDQPIIFVGETTTQSVHDPLAEMLRVFGCTTLRCQKAAYCIAQPVRVASPVSEIRALSG